MRQQTHFHVLKYWHLMPIVRHGYVVTNHGLHYFSQEDRQEMGQILEEFETMRQQTAKSAKLAVSGPNVEIGGFHTVLEDRFSDKKTAATLLEKLHAVLQRNPVHPKVYVEIDKVFNELGQRPSDDLAAAITHGIERYHESERDYNASRVLNMPQNNPYPTMCWQKEKQIQKGRKIKEKK